MMQTPRDQQGTGPPVEDSRGGVSYVRATDAGRESKSTSDGIIPGADRDLGAGRGRKRGGNRTRDGSHRLARGTSCGRP